MAKEEKSKSDLDFLSKIRKNVEDWMSYYSENNEKYKRMQDAIYDPDSLYNVDEYKFYKESGRPTLTYNLLQRETNALTASFSDNVPSTKVTSKNTQKDSQEDVDIIDSSLRAIALSSESSRAYKKAFKDMSVSGYGAYEIGYSDDVGNPFVQTPRVFEVDDPTCVGWDTSAKHDNKEDGDFCFKLVEVALDRFKDQYPNIVAPQSFRTKHVKWQTCKTIMVLHMWRKEYFDQSKSLMSNGSVINTDDEDEYLANANKSILEDLQNSPLTPANPVTVMDTKVIKENKITKYIAIHNYVLEEVPWQSKKLPIIQMCGFKEIMSSTERVFGLIEWLVSPQMEYNFGSNDHIYQVLTKSNAQFMGTKAMIPDDQMDAWTNPQRKQGILLHTYDDKGNKPEVLPQQTISNDSQTIIDRSLSTFQNIIGRFDSAIGEQSNEISGYAISKRQKASHTNIKDLYDRARIAMEVGTEALLDLMTGLFDTERSVTTMDEEGKKESVVINGDNGAKNPIKQGIYSVEVTLADSYEIQDQQTAQTLTALSQAYPAVAPYLADLTVESLPLKNKDKIVNRIHRNVIPQIALEEGSQDQIVIQNVQKQQQAQQQQVQKQQQLQQIEEQAVQLKLESAQLDNSKKQLDMVLDRMDALDKRLNALANQTNSEATMMNAETTRSEVGINAQIAVTKSDAEIDKADKEVRIEAMKTINEISRSNI